MVNVDFDKYSFILDGKREIIRAAAVHYFRMPGFDTWKDRLSKVKYSGYNTIDMYINWGFHSPEPGKYDFSGIRDIKKLMQIATDMGLYIISRPGPYINAELSGGGFPDWILNKKDLVLRNKKDNDFIYSKEYMKHVKEWYDNIIPIVMECPNVIVLQIENEYHTNELEPDYIQELKEYVRSMGCELPLMHNDMYAAGLYADVVDIYALDNYSVTYFDQPWQSFPEVFSVLDNLEENTREFCEKSPMFIAELQAGWFDKWGGMGYKEMRKALGREHLDIVTKSSLSQGVTGFTHYMGCGGTNWGNLASTEVYSSYDFASPVTEAGLATDRLYQARIINNFLSSFDITRTELAENQPIIKSSSPDANLTYFLRTNLKDNSKWLFIRNDSIGKTEAYVNGEYSIEIDPQEMLILPSFLNLNDIEIVYSTLPLMYRKHNSNKQLIFVKTSLSGELSIIVPENYDVELNSSTDNISLSREGETLCVSFSKKPVFDNPIILTLKGEGKKSSFMFLPESMIDYISIIDDHIIVGPDLITTDESKILLASSESKRFYSVDIDANIEFQEIEKPDEVDSILVDDWKIHDLAVEIRGEDLTGTSWKEVKQDLDTDSNEVYGSYFWYKSEYDGKLSELELNVRHCFAVYLNGEEIFSHDSFNSISGPDTDEPVSFKIPYCMQKERNQIILLVQNMGHNKGFEDDTTNPRGLLSYSTKPESNLKWFVKEAFTQEAICDESLTNLPEIKSQRKVICAVSEFSFSPPDEHQVPLGLVFNKPPFNKASIYLNDVLIGHYWQDKGPQDKFYLPEEFYARDGSQNTIKLVIWYRGIDNVKNYTSLFNNVNIFIEPYSVYRLTELEEIK